METFLNGLDVEINADGGFVAGKIEKRVFSFSDGPVVEWVGCEIDTNGNVVAGKIEKMVEWYLNREVEEWVG